ncbi:hypothetical protein E4U55_001873 [Claviceps digitariae]|nr:hypothetical protein E4U55_001873 [Claviceps digitariae]
METPQTDAPAATAPASTTVRLPPLSPRNSSSDEDSTWQAPGVETWGSSTDDDDDDDDDDAEGSIVEVVEKKPQMNTTASQATASARPQLSDYSHIISAHKKWLENKTAAAASGSSTKSNGHGTKTDSPRLSSVKMETPVPLPPHPLEALANKPGGSFKRLLDGGIQISHNPTPSQLRQRLADSAARTLSSTPVTPVPLPLSVRQKESSASSTSKQSPASIDGRKSWSPAPNKNSQHTIGLASDNRLYSVWVDARGLHVPTRGALIPAKYRLHDDPEYPFICPIRDCRRTLPNLNALGGHFSAAHKYAQVNDNLDGTLTQVGTYKNVTGHSPCVVVSQKTAPPDAPPPIEPRLPDTVASRLVHPKRQLNDQGGMRFKRQMLHADSTQTVAAGNDTGAWPELLTLAAEALGRDPKDAHQLKQGKFPAHRPSRQTSSSTMGTGPVAPYSSNVSPTPSTQSASQDGPELTLAGRRSIRQSVLARLQADKDVSGSRSFTRSPSVQREGAQYGQSNQSEKADYEMEDWEIAPGRITSKDSLHNVAFSGAFLASSTPIVVCSDISFNVLTIRPGQIHRTSIQRDKMQMYSLASGKVQVSIGGQTVQLGPNGAFPLRPGERCTIENKLYNEATLHCTTVSDYVMNSAES